MGMKSQDRLTLEIVRQFQEIMRMKFQCSGLKVNLEVSQSKNAGERKNKKVVGEELTVSFLFFKEEGYNHFYFWILRKNAFFF